MTDMTSELKNHDQYMKLNLIYIVNCTKKNKIWISEVFTYTRCYIFKERSTHINDSLFFIRMLYKDAYWRFMICFFIFLS